MDVKNTQQNISINTSTVSAAKTSQSAATTPENNFAEELKKVENDTKIKEQKSEEADDKDKIQDSDKDKVEKKQKSEIDTSPQEPDSETEEIDAETKDIDDKNKKEEQKSEKDSVNNAIDGLQDIVNEFNKMGQKDELESEPIKPDNDFADKKTKISNEDNTLIDNNMNIQEPSEKLNVQTEANMNFNSSEQPFSEFVNPEKAKDVLKSNAKEIAEEKAILSTMEENIAIANKNMLMKQKAKEAENKQQATENRTQTIQNETGIKKVDTKTHIVVDTIVSYDNVIMDKADVEFFVNLVENGVVNLSDVQHAEQSSRVSKTLADLLVKAMNENKPVRIDFDNDISVIIKIDRAGKISADFLPSSQVAEAYLKENLPLLRQRFDDNNINYNELNQRKQKQDSQDNRKKGRKDE